MQSLWFSQHLFLPQECTKLQRNVKNIFLYQPLILIQSVRWERGVVGSRNAPDSFDLERFFSTELWIGKSLQQMYQWVPYVLPVTAEGMLKREWRVCRAEKQVVHTWTGLNSYSVGPRDGLLWNNMELCVLEQGYSGPPVIMTAQGTACLCFFI